jgi:hypothetical protein
MLWQREALRINAKAEFRTERRAAEQQSEEGRQNATDLHGSAKIGNCESERFNANA